MRHNKRDVNFSLYAITESSLEKDKLLRKVSQAIKAGITVLQLREKELSSRDVLEKAVLLREMVALPVAFIINDRVDIALACQADGVHLGQTDIPLPVARKIMGKDKIIGVSTHNVKQAEKAEAQGADYVGIGPVFSTPTKPHAPAPIGCQLVREVKTKVNIPVVAIGGISPGNVRQVLETGVDGVAVISAIFKQQDVLVATRKLRKIIQEYRS